MAILATDNFTRADNASLGSPWNPNSGDSDANGFKIASNTAQPDNVTQDSSEGNSAVTWPTDYYAEVTYGTTNANGVGAGSGPSVYQSITAKTMYRAVANASGSELLRFNAGVSGSLFSSAGTTFASGDKLRLEIRVNGANRDWVLKKNGTQYASGSDTSPLTTSAQAGIAHSSTSTTGAITFWEGGDFTAGGAVLGPFHSEGVGIRGPRGRTMRPQLYPDTIPFVQDGSTISGPFRRGMGPRMRFRLAQLFPNASLNAYSLTSSVGVFTLTGIAAALQHNDDLIAAKSTFVLTGNAANTLVGRVVAAAAGTFVLTGIAANFARTYVLTAAKGTFVLAGNVINLLVGRVVSALPGGIVLTGNSAGFLRSYVMATSTGVFVLTGQSANLVYTPSGGGGSTDTQSNPFLLGVSKLMNRR